MMGIAKLKAILLASTAAVALMGGVAVVGVATLPRLASAQATTTKVSASTPLEALRALAAGIREGDADVVRQLIQAETDQQKAVVEVQSRFCRAHADFRRAILAKWGRAELDKVPHLVGPTHVPPDATESIDGDTAKVILGAFPMPMVKSDGMWKLSYDALASNSMPIPQEKMVSYHEGVIKTVDSITDRINDGEFKDVTQVMGDLQAEIAENARNLNNAK